MSRDSTPSIEEVSEADENLRIITEHIRACRKIFESMPSEEQQQLRAEAEQEALAKLEPHLTRVNPAMLRR